MLSYETRGRWIGRFFALAWLCMLAWPITQALQGSPDYPNPWPVIAIIVAFAAIYVWFWFRVAYGGSRVAFAIAIGGMLGIILVSVVGSGGAAAISISYMLIYVAVAAAVWSGWKTGIAWCIGLGLLAAAIGVISNRNHLPDLNPVVLVTLIGLGMVGVRQLINAIERLKSAQDELSRLAVGEERMRFARDLHDLLGHSLSVIVLKSEVARNMLDRDPGRAAGEIADIERVARDSLRDVRAAVAGYRQTSLDAELHGAREMLESAGISVRYDQKAGELPEDTESVLAWAVREGATNILRHSRANECFVRLARDNGAAVLVITDDGTGRLEPGSAPGNGLQGLGERVAAVGGKMRAEQLAGRGFRLAVRVPVPEASSN
ncbi:MAG: sensor histidine kinase [Candidatus Dormiibacterota bacterium]